MPARVGQTPGPATVGDSRSVPAGPPAGRRTQEQERVTATVTSTGGPGKAWGYARAGIGIDWIMIAMLLHHCDPPLTRLIIIRLAASLSKKAEAIFPSRANEFNTGGGPRPWPYSAKLWPCSGVWRRVRVHHVLFRK